MINYIQGSIVNSPEDRIIVQQVNCQGAMGKGVDKAIYERNPFVKQQYHAYCNQRFKERMSSPANLLGSILVAETPSHERKVICLFSQENYWRYGDQRGEIYTSYSAMEDALNHVAFRFKGQNITFAIPVGIGCGYANGDWEKVKSLIEECLKDFNIEYYNYTN